MALSWNEIRIRAVEFSNEWKDEVSEDAEAKSFWDGFFNVFGISRRRVATFEQAVKKIDGQGFIDLLWKGVILVEHKSRGKDLNKAYKQAKDYFPGIKDVDLPRYILVSDFERFRLYDLEQGDQHEFLLKDFVNHVELFGFIAGYEKRSFKEEDPVNIAAAELMGKLHDQLKDIGYTGHALELYLVRLLFCLFADDTTIFEKGIFREYIETKTKEDGSDLALHIDALFSVLNTPATTRLKTLDDHLKAFPYVNGALFEERLPLAAFDSKMRQILLECCSLDWGKISPAIFGSMFQSVMDAKARRDLGAHYTSEKNILKLIKPLFLDELWGEFEDNKHDKRKLQQLHHRISKLTFLDPAAGCGNFLVISYRELRQLELAIVQQLLQGQQVLDIGHYFLVNVDQFYGIEYEEFPAHIAQVAMWLMDHQMNMVAGQQFGQYFARLPLQKSATIVHGNSLCTDWESLQSEGAYFSNVLGNPPFLGKAFQSPEQKADMDRVFAGVSGAGVLDYVSAWYLKAAQYIQKANSKGGENEGRTKVGFVSTNSICQGEQPGVLWNELFNRYHVKIHFAHRTFKWGNEARANAAVHVVIIGFSNFDIPEKRLYEYDDVSAEPHLRIVKNINPYLVEGKDNFIQSRKRPICNVPEASFGSMPNDGGYLLLSDEEKVQLIQRDQGAASFIKPFLGSQEFINGIKRWCIWLKDVPPHEYSRVQGIMDRIKAVRDYRLNSTRAATRKLADFPMLFGEIRQPNSNYLLIPGVSSENRKYIPIGFIDKDVIASNLAHTVPDADLYLFGILTSLMHMTWVRFVCGRLESRYRYSSSIVYNNFPFPLLPTEKQKESVVAAAQGVLDARNMFSESTYADLYNPNTTPPQLVKAHQALDKVVDLCYRPQPFTTEAKRMEFLFDLYDQYTNQLFAGEKKKKIKNITTTT